MALLETLYRDNVHTGTSRETDMARNTSITLGNHFEAFVSQQVDSGRFGSASEVIRAGLRMLEDSDAKMNALRLALIEGEKSGFTDYSYDALLSELDEEAQQSG